MNRSHACLNAIGCAVPDHDVHALFISWAAEQIGSERERALFRKMAEQSGIEHRWSVLPLKPGIASLVSQGGFYGGSAQPSTSERMVVYAAEAPKLALEAVAALSEEVDLGGVSHLIVASCTGFVAPGIDQIVAEAIGLPQVERTLVGFMGCYAAVAALRLARHVVRSEPQAQVLVITVELSSLHLQREQTIEPLLAMLQFGDGAAAALVTAERSGIAIERPFAIALPESAELIRWTVADTGFCMHLSGEVPQRISRALQNEAVRTAMLGSVDRDEIGAWAVHAGGRSILNAVERGLMLESGALEASRDVLARFGNMSSSTLMFVLARLLGSETGGKGIALAFGPGLAAEGFQFERCH